MIRMLVQFMGAEEFKIGIRQYLQKFKYKNARTVDLWDALEHSSGGLIHVAKFMNAWTRQIGYPLLRVQLTNSKIHLRQERYLSSGVATKDEDETLWQIPLLMVSSSQDAPTKEILLKKEETLIAPSDGMFVKVNNQQCGFYRTLYSNQHLQTLGKRCKQGKLDVNDCIGLITDSFALSKSGHLSVVNALTLIDGNFNNCTDYTYAPPF